MNENQIRADERQRVLQLIELNRVSGYGFPETVRLIHGGKSVRELVPLFVEVATEKRNVTALDRALADMDLELPADAAARMTSSPMSRAPSSTTAPRASHAGGMARDHLGRELPGSAALADNGRDLGDQVAKLMRLNRTGGGDAA